MTLDVRSDTSRRDASSGCTRVVLLFESWLSFSEREARRATNPTHTTHKARGNPAGAEENTAAKGGTQMDKWSQLYSGEEGVDPAPAGVEVEA